jgi:hypothetical protein
MFLAVAGALLMQSVPHQVTHTDSAGNPAVLLSLPAAKSAAECVHSALPAFDMMLMCTTAPGDRLTDCAPAPDRPPAPDGVTKVAVCLASGYRIRVVGADGKPVTGTTVLVPIHLRTAP